MGWLAALDLFSPSTPCPTLNTDPDVFRFRVKFGVEDCGCGKVCEKSFCMGELWIGETDCLLPVSPLDDVRGEMRPLYTEVGVSSEV
jgi:hypothetical protein